MDLERSQEKLAELYRAYKSAKSKEQADLLKEARLSAILLDFSKTDVRYIDADFKSRYLDKTLPDELRTTEVDTPSIVAIPGLNRSVKAAGVNVAAARSVTDALLQAKAVEALGEAATPAEQSTAAAVISTYRDAFNEAIETAGRDARLRRKRLAAPDRIIDACKDLEQSITDLVMSRGNASLDEGAFDDAIDRLRTVLDKLAVEAQRSIDLPGNGLGWLIAAVNVKRPEA
jgi:hypothetical protein